MAKRYKLVDKFLGYANKRDVTNLPSGYLVSPSQNVLINDGEKVVSRKGYTLYGAANAALTPIVSSHVWNTSTGTELPLRSYTGELEFYYASAWRRLANGFSTSVAFNFAEWWDNTEKLDLLLFVNGDSNMRMWSGGVTTIASVGTNTLTKNTSDEATWAESRFLVGGTRTVIIAGVTYAYTGGESTATLTGVTPDPAIAAPAIAVGAVAHQGIRTTTNTPASGFNSSIIEMLNNQIYVGDLEKRTVYVSKNTSYTDYTSSTPRIPGDGLGGGITIDSPPVAFIPQETDMYISGARDQWYQTKFTLSSDNTKEALTIIRLKTAPLKGARTQGSVGKLGNEVAYISRDKTLELLGRVTNISTPQTVPLSYPVEIDFESLNYTISPHVKFWRGLLYMVFPSSSTMMVYDAIQGFWNPPQIVPFRRLEIINGELYGHSNATPETYLLETGYNDNTAPIECIAAFSYRNFGDRANLKNHNEYYSEGYMPSNTTVDLMLKYDFGGATSITEHEIDGSDSTIIFETISDGSIGKNPIGSNPIGSTTDSSSGFAKFRIIHTFPKQDYFEYQAIYSSNEIDTPWELIGQGPNAGLSTANKLAITQ